MGKEEQLLSMSIKDSLQQASKFVGKISQLSESYSGIEDAELEHSPMDEANEMLVWYMKKLYRDVAILAERMGLSQTASRIHQEFDAYTDADLSYVESTPYDHGLHSPRLGKVRGHFDSLATMTVGAELTGLDIFRTILENTPAIIKLTGADPKQETDVQREVYKVLQIAFHDAMREIPVGQLMKTYKPDLGVRSLMAAAEYKFAETEAEVRHALDGIYTDMKGYRGHYEWRNFYAVIYTTDNIVHPKKLEAEFLGVNAETNWTPIVVVGKGERKAKVARSKPGPKPKGI